MHNSIAELEEEKIRRSFRCGFLTTFFSLFIYWGILENFTPSLSNIAQITLGFSFALVTGVATYHISKWEFNNVHIVKMELKELQKKIAKLEETIDTKTQ